MLQAFLYFPGLIRVPDAEVAVSSGSKILVRDRTIC